MVGHRYIVKLRITSKHWYPDQDGGSEEKAYERTTEERYDMVCRERGLLACHGMVDALVTEDFGVPGVHGGYGVGWCYVVDGVEYMGEVRLGGEK